MWRSPFSIWRLKNLRRPMTNKCITWISMNLRANLDWWNLRFCADSRTMTEHRLNYRPCFMITSLMLQRQCSLLSKCRGEVRAKWTRWDSLLRAVSSWQSGRAIQSKIINGFVTQPRTSSSRIWVTFKLLFWRIKDWRRINNSHVFKKVDILSERRSAF